MEDRDNDPARQLRAIDYRVKIWLLVVSLATIALLAAAALRENVFAEWRTLRAQYATILAAKASDPRGRAAARQFEVQIVQNYVPELGAVDRCMTCHAGIEDPRMVDQPQPFTTHPGRYLQSHDPAKFGCTVCHQGQGRATEVAAAHGRVAYWDRPLLAPSLVKTTCTQCHAEVDLYGPRGLFSQAEGTGRAAADELLAAGRRLLRERGCLGCHTLNGKGGTIGPDLTFVGNKSHHDFDFSHLGKNAPREVTYWLTQHFLAPASVSPGTLMPPVGGAPDGSQATAEAEALTAYMLSLRRKESGRYASLEQTPAVDAETGRELYAQYCSACHGPDGRQGMVADIRTPALNNANALAAASDDYYRFIIANGRSNTAMPAWGKGHGNLSREEIDRIVAYIRSWDAEGPRLGDIRSRSGDPRRGRAYYRGRCAGCHGSNGQGGVGNSLNSATFLAVADDRFLARSIIYGRPGTAMPSWKRLPTQAVSDILAYIRTWQPPPPTFAEVAASMKATSASANAEIGRRLFRSSCAACHGRDGRGGIGPAVTGADFLQVVDDVYMYRAITAGRPGTAMPAWRQLSADDVGALIAYLRSFQPEQPLELEPVPVLAGDYAVGEIYYQVSCANCHGEQGIGGVGPRLASPAFLSSVSDAALFQWISRGRVGTAMKGFLAEAQGPTQLTSGQIADIIAYLRHIGTREELPVLRTGIGNPTVGKRLFQGHCASCHGQDGEGASGPQLNNPAFLRTASDGFLTATITLGRRGTPMQPMVRGQEGLGQIRPRNVADIIAYMRLWAFPQTWRKTRRVTEMSHRAITSGHDHYQRYCSGCHGPHGRGQRDGPGYYAPALNNPEFLAAASDGFLLATIARGREGTPMRPFGEGAGGIVSLKAHELDEIISFIRSWQARPAPATGREES
ncbi:MAG: c-type cytochrome [Candidatus Binatia bacterium]